jgi:hypothetical protein
MQRLSPLCLLLLGALAAGACGTSRLVERNQYGGTLALVGFDRQKAMENAHITMASHCGPGAYTVVSEGETVTGTQTQESDETKATKKGTVVRSGGSTTSNTTEWRIQYRCNNAPPGVAAFTGAPGQPPYGAPAQAPGYPPPQQPAPAGYPQQPYPQQPAPAGYPQQPYPGQPAPAGYPQQPYPQQPAPAYPQQPYPPPAPPQGPR